MRSYTVDPISKLRVLSASPGFCWTSSHLGHVRWWRWRHGTAIHTAIVSSRSGASYRHAHAVKSACPRALPDRHHLNRMLWTFPRCQAACPCKLPPGATSRNRAAFDSIRYVSSQAVVPGCAAFRKTQHFWNRGLAAPKKLRLTIQSFLRGRGSACCCALLLPGLCGSLGMDLHRGAGQRRVFQLAARPGGER
ncbi:hypothetical protein L1887_63201 [Cichorium endivia]|nr:hypothetical protein L1887_63201 [Cichorium endivia]